MRSIFVALTLKSFPPVLPPKSSAASPEMSEKASLIPPDSYLLKEIRA